MPEVLRIALRLLGLVLLVLGAVCLVLLIKPGPQAVAEAMGAACAHNSGLGPSEQCTWWDAASLLWSGVWVSLIVGAVLRVVTRPRGRGPLTIDLRRRRQR
ncbi:hypothetical protein [Mycobacterium deserti]|uniref:Transmembrane protein n=1 Tax=Mycobacterium deserti TaxID=2978347 RepID=A0ABT2MFQ4_9MYCO|nr:hypothetical protein [Mycobacterium deserti]MCT7659940.1 hypothetical protein [Mycobacterium deserti]